MNRQIGNQELGQIVVTGDRTEMRARVPRRIVYVRVLVSVAIVLGIVVGVLVPAHRVQRRVAATQHYDRAVAAYMMSDVAAARMLLAEVAQIYPDLSIGVLAKLKIAFLCYDEQDLEQASELFSRFLKEHPERIVHLPETPSREYFGELDLVAWFFLAKISRDRGDHETAHDWFKRILKTGSKNPANIIIAETRSIVRRWNRIPINHLPSK